MKKTVWTFGLIAGAILSVMMLLTLPFLEKIGTERGYIVGYTTMVLAFLLVFFGIRSYRDNVGGGKVSFGRALAIGTLITLVASFCYVATWEVIFYKITPDFGDKFKAAQIAKARADGGSPQVIQKKVADAEKFAELYKNPIVNIGMTLIEPLPVGLVFALVAAGVLSRKRRPADAAST
ncbi:MAG: DUF4199 domain-containing protein [Gemmatimonadota bacterium]|nr:DUF4199 domain-containing protein [Gemmatimonadota bacterium]